MRQEVQVFDRVSRGQWRWKIDEFVQSRLLPEAQRRTQRHGTKKTQDSKRLQDFVSLGTVMSNDQSPFAFLFCFEVQTEWHIDCKGLDNPREECCAGSSLIQSDSHRSLLATLSVRELLSSTLHCTAAQAVQPTSKQHSFMFSGSKVLSCTCHHYSHLRNISAKYVAVQDMKTSFVLTMCSEFTSLQQMSLERQSRSATR